MLSAEDLLAGGRLSFEIEIPPPVLTPGVLDTEDKLARVKMRPLTVADLQLISRAAKENDSLLGVLMVQKSLIEPELSVVQVSSLHLGLLRFLLQKVNEISALNVDRPDLQKHAQEPVAKAAFLLAKEFGWSPQQISELTLGQIMLHLEMMQARRGEA